MMSHCLYYTVPYYESNLYYTYSPVVVDDAPNHYQASNEEVIKHLQELAETMFPNVPKDNWKSIKITDLQIKSKVCNKLVICVCCYFFKGINKFSTTFNTLHS